jgi:glyoxylase-like metal-dependent hydrolase (beta-lactamase superfamily II)
MTVILAAAIAVLISLCPAIPAMAQSQESGIDRIYIFDGGNGHALDESLRWTPGLNVGKPIDISVSCYLIHHKTKGYFLWDTCLSDHVAAQPNGWYPTNNPKADLLWTKKKTLMAQLKEINVAPSDIKIIGISHTHPDHVGNTELFPNTLILIQRAEWEFFFGPPKPGFAVPPTESLTRPPGDPTPFFSKDHPVQLVDEDLDVFGDGSAMIFSTPGHTPGHQSLLVHLPKTGWVILTADAVHLRTNWDDDRIPYFAPMPLNQRLETLLSMQRMRNISAFYHAQLWINHEKVESDQMKKSPQFYE